MMPIPPAPGTEVLRSKLQRMSRELEAAKQVSASERGGELVSQLKALERETAAQQIAIAALRRQRQTELRGAIDSAQRMREQLTALRDAATETAEEKEQLASQLRALQQETRVLRAEKAQMVAEAQAPAPLMSKPQPVAEATQAAAPVNSLG